MKFFIEFAGLLFTISLSTLIFYFAWNAVAVDFDFLDEKWRQLGFWQSFGLIWVVRMVTSIVREPAKKWCNKCDRFIG